ncbi:MAG: hypothetical protein ACRDRN_14215 [Sciscionella sp.]
MVPPHGFAGRGRRDAIGLGEWTVDDLVGHTSRALLTVEAYLDTPGDEVEGIQRSRSPHIYLEGPRPRFPSGCPHGRLGE